MMHWILGSTSIGAAIISIAAIVAQTRLTFTFKLGRFQTYWFAVMLTGFIGLDAGFIAAGSIDWPRPLGAIFILAGLASLMGFLFGLTQWLIGLQNRHHIFGPNDILD